MERAGGAAQAEEYQRSSGHSTEPRGKDVKSEQQPNGFPLTVLTVGRRYSARKRFFPGGNEPYNAGYLARWREVWVDGFPGLVRLLTALNDDTGDYIVHGRVADVWRDTPPWEIVEGAPSPETIPHGVIPRWKLDHPEGATSHKTGQKYLPGGPASLVDAGSPLLHFDLDNEIIPAGMSWERPAEIAAWLWETRICASVPAFRCVSYYWQASNSAGTKGKAHLAKFHIWALLDAPVDEAERRAILRTVGADTAVASINQPNVTARPWCDGVPDPLPGDMRFGVVYGAAERASWADVQQRVPEPGIKRDRENTARRQASRGERVDVSTLGDQLTTEAGRRALSKACDRLSRTTDNRNPAINSAAYTIAGYVAGGHINPTEALAALEAAAQATGHPRWQEALRNGWESGLARPFTPRDASGRFKGAGVVALQKASEAREYLTPREARTRIADDIGEALDAAAAWTEGETPPLYAIKASPGAGKSQGMREALAACIKAREPITRKTDAGIWRDVIVYAPTGKLAEEWAAGLAALGVEAHVIRGRTAANPAEPGGAMCYRPHLAEEAGKAGLPVAATICKAKDETGAVRLCPHHPEAGGGCPYYRQFPEPREDQPNTLVMATNYLDTPPPARGEAGLRIVDEELHAVFAKDSKLRAEALTAPRMPFFDLGAGSPASREKAAAQGADVQAAGAVVLSALESGSSPILALRKQGLGSEDLREFAGVDYATGNMMPGHFPDAEDEMIASGIEAASKGNKDARKLYRLWTILAEAMEAGRDISERIVFERDFKPQAKSDPRNVVSMFWHSEPPQDTPTILLDASADPIILEALFGTQVNLREISLRPNADVIQITDRTFSSEALSRRQVRDDIAAAIRVEAMRDTLSGGGGTLAVAPKKIVRHFFEDAGHALGNMTAAEADAYMQGTKLHGASWLWFGPGARGVNHYREFSTVFVAGRWEWPVEALEDLARSLFGDAKDELTFVQPDENGRRLMPMELTPFPMADGSAFGVEVRVHPDPRIRALQRQVREEVTLQVVERLRLGHAPTRKRVVLASAVPIPGLPVSELREWNDYAPGRAMAALAEAFTARGVAGIRLSAAGLAADAPRTFATPDAAKNWLRTPEAVKGLEAIKWGGAANMSLNSGSTPFKPVLLSLRFHGQRGKPTRAILLGAPTIEAVTTAWPGVASFDVIGDVERSKPSPEPMPDEEAEALAAQLELMGFRDLKPNVWREKTMHAGKAERRPRREPIHHHEPKTPRNERQGHDGLPPLPPPAHEQERDR